MFQKAVCFPTSLFCALRAETQFYSCSIFLKYKCDYIGYVRLVPVSAFKTSSVISDTLIE
jgi:hypothetical protein